MNLYQSVQLLAPVLSGWELRALCGKLGAPTGREFQVPVQATGAEFDRLVSIIGHDGARKLVEHAGGTAVLIPLGLDGIMAARDQQARELAAEGMSLAEITEALTVRALTGGGMAPTEEVVNDILSGRGWHERRTRPASYRPAARPPRPAGWRALRAAGPKSRPAARPAGRPNSGSGRPPPPAVTPAG
jgi:hypothetical protein